MDVLSWAGSAMTHGRTDLHDSHVNSVSVSCISSMCNHVYGNMQASSDGASVNGWHCEAQLSGYNILETATTPNL